VVERLASRLGVAWRRPLFARYSIARATESDLCLLRPMTFMNASGQVLASVMRRCGATLRDLVVVCDSLDLPPGAARFRLRGSSGGQKGLESIIAAAGTDEIPRIAIGIGRPVAKSDIVSHVLSRPEGRDAEAITAAVERCVEALLRLPRDGAGRLMNDLNRTVSLENPGGPA
jgi:peptidyl-tRNA hydrolase, PTH1 family